MNQHDVIILGAGAAGLMCAIEAGKRGRRVLVLERAEKIGKKILISGGGRCNFTNLHTTAEHFLSANRHFAKSALARYTPDDFIHLVRKHRIPYHEKKLGQLFCDRSARDITAMLEKECQDVGVEILLNAKVKKIDHAESGFAVPTENSTFSAQSVVVATGGLSIPKIGATSFGYDLARRFGLEIVPARPALVPLAFDAGDRKRWCDLAGVSLAMAASTAGSKQTFRENALITHEGLSGPAILQISSYWKPGSALSLDLAPGIDLPKEFLSRGPRDPAGWKSLLREILPRRFADRWLEFFPLPGTSDRALAEAAHQIHAWEIAPAGTAGYGKAEVTAGGVDTDELSAQTMEAKKVPGLFFVGEVVDVTGHLGGFNFQWAWASGFCAGQVV